MGQNRLSLIDSYSLQYDFLEADVGSVGDAFVLPWNSVFVKFERIWLSLGKLGILQIIIIVW